MRETGTEAEHFKLIDAEYEYLVAQGISADSVCMFPPGSPERVAIYELRYETGLPINHPDDLKNFPTPHLRGSRSNPVTDVDRTVSVSDFRP